ncbi:MAG: RNA methyltransferase [Candidatus Krumholzibacteriia bacterium]
MNADRPAPSLDNVVIVLSHTTEPMNIGAACRAMKTMGLRHLRLIAPLNPKGRGARALAHGAEDILEAAAVVETLAEAVADCTVVTGTTARPRQLRKHALLTPAELGDHMADHAREGKVALLFGTERTGLTNDEVDICRYLSTVDTAPEQPSLNLAQAVMLYCWELRQALSRAGAGTDSHTALPARGPGVRRPEMRVRHPHRSTKPPQQQELDAMYAHLAAVMEAVDYTPHERRKFLTYLRQLHQRAGIVNWETHIYHILCKRILKALGRPKYDGQVPPDLMSGDDA